MSKNINKDQPAPYDSRHIEFDNRLDMACGMVLATLAIVEWLRPQFWVIENPVGRIRNMVPEIGEPRLKFDPCDYGDPYTKRTYLYGQFNERLPKTPFHLSIEVRFSEPAVIRLFDAPDAGLLEGAA